MADRERAAFELMLVHNLKAPLTGILASLEMLQDGDLGELNDTQRSAVHEMRTHGAEMVRMIDELVELGHARSSIFAVQRTPIDAATFLREMESGWVGRLGRLTSDRYGGGQGNHKRRPAWCRLQRDLPVHGRERGAAVCQPETVVATLRLASERDEGLEHTLCILRRNAWPVVNDRDVHCITSTFGMQRNRDTLACVDPRVHQQVVEHASQD